jgi:hypothetical protein
MDLRTCHCLFQSSTRRAVASVLRMRAADKVLSYRPDTTDLVREELSYELGTVKLRRLRAIPSWALFLQAFQ